MQVFRSGVYRFVSGYIRVGAFKEKIIFDKSEAYVLCLRRQMQNSVPECILSELQISNICFLDAKFNPHRSTVTKFQHV